MANYSPAPLPSLSTLFDVGVGGSIQEPAPLPSLSSLFGSVAVTASLQSPVPLPHLSLMFDAVGPRVLTADTGTYNYTGVSAVLKKGYLLTLASGSYSITGNDATLTKGSQARTDYPAPLPSLSSLLSGVSGHYSLALNTGVYNVSGKAAGLNKGKYLYLGTGTYIYTGAPAERDLQLTCDSGVYAMVGHELSSGAVFNLLLDTGVYTLSGSDADLKRSFKLALATGSYTVTGQPATLTFNRIVNSLDMGSYTLTGNNANLKLNRKLNCQTGSYILSGHTARLRGPNDPPGITVTVYSGLSKSPKERNSLSKPIHVLTPLGANQYDVTVEPAVVSDKTPSTNYEGYDYDDN